MRVTNFGHCLNLNYFSGVVHITDISTQEDSFLVSGVQKNLHCKVHGKYSTHTYSALVAIKRTIQGFFRGDAPLEDFVLPLGDPPKLF